MLPTLSARAGRKSTHCLPGRLKDRKCRINAHHVFLGINCHSQHVACFECLWSIGYPFVDGPIGANDINYDQIFTSYKIISASRSLKSVQDLPFTIHVITREEILKNGYITLVDVLKYLPGIRGSQPGSALEGETFLMRGLAGNAYTKILVNDLPVKPTVVSGMPIGAQLPIRQAERIEIIYGTGAVTYGTDAAAGIINIITRDSERPLFAHADLVLGPDNYNGVNVMVGGKLGRNRNILKFNVYGSSTQADNRRVVYDESSLYNPDNYFGGSRKYLDSPNYRGSPGNPVINDLPHLSRMLGLDLRYRGFRASFHRLYRHDPSATGMNPAAVSYASPLNFVGENISRYTLSYSRDFNRVGFTTNFTYLDYKMDSQSSYAYVKPSIATILDSLIVEVGETSQQDSLRSAVIERLLTGSRFSYAASNDFFFEQLVNYYPLPILEVVGGINYRFSQNFPIINFLPVPFRATVSYKTESGPDQGPIQTNTLKYDNLGLFGQVYLTLNRLNLIGGIRWDNDERFGNAISPRLAMMYKITDDMRFRFSFGRAFRTPTPFYNANTYVFTGDNLLGRIRTGRQQLDAETTKTFEAGLRWKISDQFEADASLFRMKTSNFISYNFSDRSALQFVDNVVTIGYFNDEKSAVLLYGIQANLHYKSLIPAIGLGLQADISYATGEEVLPFGQGTLDRVRMQPDWYGHLHVYATPLKDWDLGLRLTGSTGWLLRFALQQAAMADNLTPFMTSGYTTLDLYSRWRISPDFQVSLQLNNLLNEKYGGISATGFLDDLWYNPQQLRNFRIGINYLLN